MQISQKILSKKKNPSNPPTNAPFYPAEIGQNNLNTDDTELHL